MRKEELPGLVNLSMVNKRTRINAISSIFDHIFFTQQWGSEAEPWAGVENNIEIILRNETLVSSVRAFDFHPWVHSPSESKIPSSFFTLLFSFPVLRELSIGVQDSYMPQIQQELNDRFLSSARLPESLQSLCIPDPRWMFLVDNIPRLEYLVIKKRASSVDDPSFEFNVQKLGISHPNLKKLHCQTPCKTENIQEVARALPNLRDIGLVGWVSWRQSESLMHHLACYSTLSKLETISIPHLTSLGLNYYPPRCGNAYRSNPGLKARLHAQRKQIIRQILNAIEHEVLTKGASRLQRVDIGGTICERNASGRFQRSRYIYFQGPTGRRPVEEDVSGDEDESKEE
ncbi:hypothetical protein FRC17_011044 [Serendipita sp. 399]|nr:hypothetical protein FRC17_011044 [Serendipita sp. 399]